MISKLIWLCYSVVISFYLALLGLFWLCVFFRYLQSCFWFMFETPFVYPTQFSSLPIAHEMKLWLMVFFFFLLVIFILVLSLFSLHLIFLCFWLSMEDRHSLCGLKWAGRSKIAGYEFYKKAKVNVWLMTILSNWFVFWQDSLFADEFACIADW